MTPTVTREEAILILQRIRSSAEAALQEGVAAIHVTLTREHPPTGNEVMLCGHQGPRGVVINAVPAGDCQWRVTARFRAGRLIVWTTKAIEALLH